MRGDDYNGAATGALSHFPAVPDALSTIRCRILTLRIHKIVRVKSTHGYNAGAAHLLKLPERKGKAGAQVRAAVASELDHA